MVDVRLERRRIAWLTVLQVMMVVVGIGIFLVLKYLLTQTLTIGAIQQWLWAEILHQPSFWNTPPGITLALLSVPFSLVVSRNAAGIAVRAGRMTRQVKRDILALRVVENLKQGRAEPFTLYLRSFSQEDAWRRRKGIWWYLRYEGFGIDAETLELEMAAGVARKYPLIAVGQRGYELGAGRLPATEDEWEDLMRLLMERATAIFIVPGTTRGVLWEMKTLCREHHAKTWYVMPPTKFYRDDAARAEKDWRDAALACAEFATLPPYHPRGSMFRFDAQGRVGETIRF